MHVNWVFPMLAHGGGVRGREREKTRGKERGTGRGSVGEQLGPSLAGGGGRKRWALPGHCCPQGDQATMAPLSREDNELIRARVRPAVYN